MILIGLLVVVAAVAGYFYVNDTADVVSGGDVLGNVETNTNIPDTNVPDTNVPNESISTQTNTPAQAETPTQQTPNTQQNTVTQTDTTATPQQNTTSETPVESQQTTNNTESTDTASEQVRDSAKEGNTTTETQTNEQAQRPEETSTQANNAMTDGINNAYFAKEIYVKKGNELSENSPYTYTFNNNQNFSNKTKDTVAGEILSIINKLLDENTFAKKEVILSSLTADSYKGRRQNNDVGDTVTFNIYKKQIEYKKIDNASVGSEVYVVAETTNLDGEEVTITIQEKEELLVDNDAPLNIVEVLEGIEDKESSTSKEVTEIKAKVTDGQASKKIKLRPKGDEDLEEWKDKLAENELKIDFLWLKVKPEGDKTEFLKKDGKYFELQGCLCSAYKIENNQLKGPNVIYTKAGSKVKTGESIGTIEAIVLHRTTGGTTSSGIKQTKGAHFYVDADRDGNDGEIFQAVNLDKIANHVTKVSYRHKTVVHDHINNSNAIAIEVVGYHYYSTNGNGVIKSDYGNDVPDSSKLTKAYRYIDENGHIETTKHYWDILTEKQIQSVVCIVKKLMKEYNLTKDDILTHEYLQSKKEGEGKAICDAIKSQL